MVKVTSAKVSGARSDLDTRLVHVRRVLPSPDTTGGASPATGELRHVVTSRRADSIHEGDLGDAELTLPQSGGDLQC